MRSRSPDLNRAAAQDRGQICTAEYQTVSFFAQRAGARRAYLFPWRSIDYMGPMLCRRARFSSGCSPLRFAKTTQFSAAASRLRRTHRGKALSVATSFGTNPTKLGSQRQVLSAWISIFESMPRALRLGDSMSSLAHARSEPMRRYKQDRSRAQPSRASTRANADSARREL
jgi:hypothetical protein